MPWGESEWTVSQGTAARGAQDSEHDLKTLLWQVLHHVQDAKLSMRLSRKLKTAAMQKLRNRAPALQAFELDNSGSE